MSVQRECAWSAASEAAWIALSPPSEGQGEGSVSYRVAENPDPVERQAGVLVNDRRIAVVQRAAACRYQADRRGGGAVPASGGELIVDVRTHAACGWTASSAVPWASVAPASGKGEGAVRVTVIANAGSSREVDVLVAGVRVTAPQLGSTTAPPSPAPGPDPAPPPPVPVPPPSPGPSPAPDPAPPPPPEPEPEPTPVRRVDVEGPVTGVSGRCPEVTFRVRGQAIYTTGLTRYDDGSCERLSNGQKVEVGGMLMSDGRVRADEIEIDD